jgi:hypothetical protein
MAWVGCTAMVLAMIYAAAIALAVRDRFIPRPEYVPKAPKPKSRWMLIPLILLSPALMLGVGVALVVILPAFIFVYCANWYRGRETH